MTIRKRIVLIFIILFGAVLSISSQPLSLEWDGTLRRIRVPILMYHYIEELPTDADDIRQGLTISPTLFREHLTYLKSESYTTIDFAALNRALNQGDVLPFNPVILTFDDSYINHYTIAYPILKDFDMAGTFFVITSALDNNRAGYMTWQQVTEMSDMGMEIATHTKNHIDLRQRDNSLLVYEIMGSLESIQAKIPDYSLALAYPMGRYDSATLNLLATTPLQRAVTTQMGIYATTDNHFELPRIRINPDTTVYGLDRLLNGAINN